MLSSWKHRFVLSLVAGGDAQQPAGQHERVMLAPVRRSDGDPSQVQRVQLDLLDPVGHVERGDEEVIHVVHPGPDRDGLPVDETHTPGGLEVGVADT